MKKVVIMRGVPGSGKGHYVKQLVSDAGRRQVAVCSADHFFERKGRAIEVGGPPMVYDFDPARLPEAHAACMTAFVQALRQGCETVVVDNTNVRQWMYEAYVEAARLAGYDVEIVEVMPVTLGELRVCAERNVHGVPPEAVYRMAWEFEPDSRAVQVRPGF